MINPRFNTSYNLLKTGSDNGRTKQVYISEDEYKKLSKLDIPIPFMQTFAFIKIEDITPNKVTVKIVNDNDGFLFWVDDEVIRALIAGDDTYFNLVKDKILSICPDAKVYKQGIKIIIVCDDILSFEFDYKNSEASIYLGRSRYNVCMAKNSFKRIVDEYKALRSKYPNAPTHYFIFDVDGLVHIDNKFIQMEKMYKTLKEQFGKDFNISLGPNVVIKIIWKEIKLRIIFSNYEFNLDIWLDTDNYVFILDKEEDVYSCIVSIIKSYTECMNTLQKLFNKNIIPNIIKINNKEKRMKFMSLDWHGKTLRFEINFDLANSIKKYIDNPDQMYRKLYDKIKNGENIGCSFELFLAVQDSTASAMLRKRPDINIIKNYHDGDYKAIERDIKEEEKGYYGEFVHMFGRHDYEANTSELLSYLDKFKKIDGEVCFTPFEAGERVFVGNTPHNFVGIIMEGFCVARFDTDIYSEIDAIGKRMRGTYESNYLSEVWAVPSELDFIGIITNDVKIYKKYKNQLNIIFLHSFPEGRRIKQIPKMNEPPVPAKVKNIKGFE